MGTFEYFDHAADVGIRVRGSSLADLFLTGAEALVGWVGPSPPGSPLLKENVSLEADGLAELFVRWLQEVLYLFHQRRAYFAGAESIDIQDGRLGAVIIARAWDDSLVSSFQEVKAVTYHGLHLSHDENGWHANVILDI